MGKKVEDLLVIENIPLNENYFLLKLNCPSGLPPMFPGQFVSIRVDSSKETFLRRPFSIHDIDYSTDQISLFIKRVGKATDSLSYIKKGETLSAIFPLGNSFTLDEEGHCLLIGGGCGVAPLLFLAKCLVEKKNSVTILIGGRSSCDIVLHEAYSGLGEVLYMTEDGSLGEKGLVTAHSFLERRIQSFDRIYTCGPEPMMKAVNRLAMKKNVPCEVSLENTMACGFGVCLCCVTETTDGRQCVCTEGPVFNTNRLKWLI